MPATPTNLLTEYQVNPIGLDETEPRFSWRLADDRRGARQTAYQLLVATAPELLAADKGNLWDSGVVKSGTSIQVLYAGDPLRAFTGARWKVRVWDADGAVSAWSDPASFELGPLTVEDWSPAADDADGEEERWRGASFIASEIVGDPQTSPPVPYFRRSFELTGEISTARLYITALGLYEASINGQLVTDDVYRPGWTDYAKRVPYQAFDVTALLRPGANALGAILGDGWYCGFIGSSRQHWGERPHLLAKLVVELADAEQRVIVCTDASWRTTTGPILLSDNYDGETYDARLELSGWDEPGFDDAAWTAAVATGDVFAHRTPSLVATTAPPVRRIEELTPQSVKEREPGVYQFDFGQNLTGRERLRICAPAGTELTLKFAEMLNDDGTLHVANLGTAKVTDRYTCKGGGEEVYEPRFTFHGFRYAEVSGAPHALDESTLTAIVLHSDCKPAGDFHCSNELVNRLQQNIQWGQRGNWLDVPTDCPQRAERLGWTGDIQVFSRTATFNMDVATFLTKYVYDLEDAQFVGGAERGTYPWVVPSMIPRGGGPGWADAGAVVPWVIYERYGDVRILEHHYTSILDYIGFLDRVRAGRAEGTWLGFGDWLSLDAVPQEIPGLGMDDRWGGTARDYLWLAYDIYSTDLASKIAAVLGRAEDSERLQHRADSGRDTFAERYLDDDGHLSETSQTAYLLALHFDLLRDPAARRTAELDLIANVEKIGHLQTGFLGTPYLLHVLSDIGRADLAYGLLERTDYPGWLYPVTQGATTIWERWDAWTADNGFRPHSMNSFNHYAYGAVGEWMFRVVAGIDTTLDGAGYQHSLIRPEIGGSLKSASAHLDTLHGRLATAWRLDGDSAMLEVTVPPNTTATLRMPVGSADLVSEDGVPLFDVDGISSVRDGDGRLECEVGAGTYQFQIRQPIIAGRVSAATTG